MGREYWSVAVSLNEHTLDFMGGSFQAFSKHQNCSYQKK